jgi:soluble lytic murein transglycosylase-like protein
MQIMPETGRGIAGALGEDGDYTVSRLDNPEKIFNMVSGILQIF